MVQELLNIKQYCHCKFKKTKTLRGRNFLEGLQLVEFNGSDFVIFKSKVREILSHFQ